MKIITQIILLSLIFNCLMLNTQCFAAASDDEWDGKDKALHAMAGFVGYTVLYNYLMENTELSPFKAKALAACSVMALGAIKESIDEEFSWKDMGANGAGVTVGIVVNFEF